MKKILVLLACLIAYSYGFAQKLVNITGKIVDEKNQPVSFAVVHLLHHPDSVLVKSTASNLNGDFIFEKINNKNFTISVNMVGFNKFKTAPFYVNGNDVKLPIIILYNLSRQLNEISVEARKPFIEHQIDKTVLNVENSIVSSGNSALEILEKAPGVIIDRQNEQIRLNNKSGVTVMVDGKTNVLSGAELTTLLGNMSSDQISTIEIITNPSSKYDASGNAGIINIKLKRNRSYGTNGSIAINGGKGIMPNSPTDLYRAGLVLNLNHREGKWNVFGSGVLARKASFNNTEVNRTTFSKGLASAFNQNFNRHNKELGIQGKLAADYYASEKTVFGVMVDVNTFKANLTTNSQTNINETEAGISALNSVLQNASSEAPLSNLIANFNIKHDLAKKDANISFDADYFGYSNIKDERFDADFFNQARTKTKSTALKNNTNAKIDIYALKIDLTLPISKTIKFETGLKSSYVITDNDFFVDQFLNDFWKNDIGKSNHFIYKENINAAYLNLSKKWIQWEIQAGLRAEHTHSNGHSITEDREVSRNYFSLFPTLFLNEKLSKNSSLNYSYSRRLDRPNYQQLNPFVFYLDPYALDQGNPYLKPQFNDNFQVAYTFKQVSFSVSYSDTRDMITQISQQDEDTRIVSVLRENLGRAQYFGASLYFPLKVFKWWNTQNNASAYRSQFDDGNLEGAVYNAYKIAYSFSTLSSFSLPKDFTFELNFWFNSPQLNGVEQTIISQYALNAGVQKSMLNKKLKLKFNVDDILLNNYWKGKLMYQNVNLQVENHYTSRRAYFSVSYNFGNQNVKSARSRNTATDDIRNRAGGK